MRKLVVVLILCLLGVGSYFAFFKDFSSKEETVVQTNDDSEIKKEFIGSDLYDASYLDEYIEYYNEHQNMKVDDIIKLVNSGVLKIDSFVYDDIILKLLDEEYFIKDNTIRYINYYKENKGLYPKEIITNVNSNLDYDFYTNTKKTDMSKGNLILVNKYNYLDKDYEPEDLVEIPIGYTTWGGYLKEDAWKAFKEMADVAYQEEIDLYSISPYRSYNTQNGLYEGYAARDGYEEADTYSARPGYSEHQTGLAVDINSADDSFANTKEAEWLKNNAYKYGFILRYPKGKEYITGYQFEPWHYRYVGKDVSKYIYEHDITFEEYYAYFVQ